MILKDTFLLKKCSNLHLQEKKINNMMTSVSSIYIYVIAQNVNYKKRHNNLLYRLHLAEQSLQILEDNL